VRGFRTPCTDHEKKKDDVAEHPKVFDHIGLLSNEPPAEGELLFI
jgi:hypothetical protein